MKPKRTTLLLNGQKPKPIEEYLSDQELEAAAKPEISQTGPVVPKGYLPTANNSACLQETVYKRLLQVFEANAVDERFVPSEIPGYFVTLSFTDFEADRAVTICKGVYKNFEQAEAMFNALVTNGESEAQAEANRNFTVMPYTLGGFTIWNRT